MNSAAAAAAAAAGAGAGAAHCDVPEKVPETVIRYFLADNMWNPKELRLRLRLLWNSTFNTNMLLVILRMHLAWCLVHKFNWTLDDACHHISADVPARPPPIGYNGCVGCWYSLTDKEKRKSWDEYKNRCGLLVTKGNGGGDGGGADGPSVGAV